MKHGPQYQPTRKAGVLFHQCEAGQHLLHWQPHNPLNPTPSFSANIITDQLQCKYEEDHFSYRHNSHFEPMKEWQWNNEYIYCTGVSISTDGRRNALATLLREVGYFSLQRRSNLWTRNNYFIKSERKCNYDVFSYRPTSVLLCLSHVNTIFQSFFHSFFYRFTQNFCSGTKVRSFVHFLVGIDCGTYKYWKLHFLNEKHALLSSYLVPRMLKIAF